MAMTSEETLLAKEEGLQWQIPEQPTVLEQAAEQVIQLYGLDTVLGSVPRIYLWIGPVPLPGEVMALEPEPA